MQEVLENAQKQAKEDKSKHMQKKRHNLDEVKEKISEKEIVNNREQDNCSESKPKPIESKLNESKDIPKLPEVDVTLQTSPTSLNRQKLLTPSKFRNQTTSVAIQTEMSK